MKAVILAAGRGERMRPLTLDTPKPLLKIKGRPILDYIFEVLPSEIDEVIVVVKYLAEKIERHLGGKFSGRKIKYAQGSDLGIAFSFLVAKDYIGKERFLVLYGDELLAAKDIKACLDHDLSIIVFKSPNPKASGVAVLDESGFFKKIIEKPENPPSDVAIGGIMVLNEKIFDYKPFKGPKGEFYLSSILGQFIKDNRVKAVFSDKFLGDITSPSDIARIEQLL
jgi:glucose-1-phosphate thymidylyltransferase